MISTCRKVQDLVDPEASYHGRLRTCRIGSENVLCWSKVLSKPWALDLESEYQFCCYRYGCDITPAPIPPFFTVETMCTFTRAAF